MIEQLTSAHFSDHLHTNFLIHYAPGQTLAAELIEVVDRTRSPRQERFMVMLRGPREPILPQGIYRLEHAALGTHELFLVPEDVDEAGTYYVLTFNRFHRA